MIFGEQSAGQVKGGRAGGVGALENEGEGMGHGEGPSQTKPCTGDSCRPLRRGGPCLSRIQ